MKSRVPSRRVSHENALRSQAGQSMVELLVILPVMLLLILATIQFALIYHAKITLNYAAYEAARAGSLNGANAYQDGSANADVSQYDAVKEGLARGLAPLYSYYEPDGDARSRMHEPALSQVEAFQQGRNTVFEAFDDHLDLVRIERLNPTKQAFIDFAVDSVIPNDNLMYRSNIAGGSSQQSIQDANLLHLRITCWYPLHVPFINTLMFNTFICGKGIGGPSFCKWASDPVCQDDVPRIPLTATAVMRMQTSVADSKGWYTAQ